MLDRNVLARIILAAIAVAGLSSAQEPAETPQQPPAAEQPAPANPADATPPVDKNQPRTGPKSAQWKGLSVKEKMKYDWVHLFDVDNMVFAGVGASFDQLRNRPGQWGQGWGPFAERYGSHVGYYIVQQQRTPFSPSRPLTTKTPAIFDRRGPPIKGGSATPSCTRSGVTTTAGG